MDEEEGRGRVMSEEQIEQLRKQIAVFAVICDRLAHMHASLTNTTTCSFILQSLGSSKSSQRWSPTPPQLHILEIIYAEVNGTPGKQRIRDITALLTPPPPPQGTVSDTSVYNWFQNRRARTKRKQHQLPSSSSAPLPRPGSLLDAHASSCLHCPDPAPGQQHSTGPKADMREAGKSPYDLLEQIKWIKDDAFR